MWAGAPWSSPFFPVLGPATWAAMSYPDISAVILDASFDDLVPLALKVMPDSWSEYSPQACPCREGGLGLGAVLTGDGSLFHGWGVGLPDVEKQEDSLPGGLSFLSP